MPYLRAAPRHTLDLSGPDRVFFFFLVSSSRQALLPAAPGSAGPVTGREPLACRLGLTRARNVANRRGLQLPLRGATVSSCLNPIPPRSELSALPAADVAGTLRRGDVGPPRRRHSERVPRHLTLAPRRHRVAPQSLQHFRTPLRVQDQGFLQDAHGTGSRGQVAEAGDQIERGTFARSSSWRETRASSLFRRRGSHGERQAWVVWPADSPSVTVVTFSFGGRSEFTHGTRRGDALPWRG